MKIKKIILVFVAFVSLFITKANAQTLNDIDTVWTTVASIRSHFTNVITLQNGNYLAYGWNSYAPTATRAANTTGSNLNEVYLVEFTEAGNIIRQKTIVLNMPTTNFSDAEGRNYITHARLVERPDRGLLILSEFEHGTGETASTANTLSTNQRFSRVIVDADWNITVNGLHGLQATNYVHNGTTYTWIIPIRLFAFQHTDDGRLLAALTGMKNLGGIRSRMEGVIFLDYNGNISGTPQSSLNVLDINGASTVVNATRDGNHYLFGEDGARIWRSTDLNCTSFTEFPAISLCAGCHRNSYSKVPYALPNSGGYTASAPTGNFPAPYNDPSNQQALWRWNNSLVLQSEPYWFSDNTRLSGLFLMNNALYASANQDRFLVKYTTYATNTNTVTDVKIAEFVFSPTAVTFNVGPDLKVRELGLNIQSHDNDGIICGGDRLVNGERRMVLGKLTVCSGFKVTPQNNFTHLSGHATSPFRFKTEGEFPGAIISYSWRVILKSGTLSSHPGATVGTVLASGASNTIPSAVYAVDEDVSKTATLLVEYKATQKWGAPEQVCNVSEAYEMILTAEKPLNIIDIDDYCIDDMPKGVPFGIKPKFKTDNGAPATGYAIDVFTAPLVGDLNGDGKPEIIALGVTEASGADVARNHGRYVNIYNGQNGNRMYRHDLGASFQQSNVYHRSTSLLAIADLNNDGVGEIVVTKTDGSIEAIRPTFADTVITGMTTLWNGTANGTPITYRAPNTSGSEFNVPHPFIADINGDGISEIIIYNKVFNGATGALLMSWKGAASTPKASSITGTDGLINRIYADPTTQTNANNIKAVAMTGRRPGNGTYSDNFVATPAIWDIDGDGMQEIVTGNRIHKVQINNLTDHTQNTYTTIEGPEYVDLLEGTTTRRHYLSDGFTRVADIDGDGHLDIIVATFANNGNLDIKILVYVWDPRYPNEVKAAITYYSDGDHGNFGIPFVGDINGKLDGWDGAARTKKLPEICILSGSVYINAINSTSTIIGRTGIKFHPLTDTKIRYNVGWNNNLTTGRFNRKISSGGHIIGLTYDAEATKVEERLKLSWGMEHSDGSNNTGITLFDFDNDGAKDLCYRDERTLRVISPKRANGGAGSDYVELSEDESTPGTSIMFKTPVFSGTSFEYPVIADVNMDGSADIVVTQGGNAWGVARSAGWINVYEYSGSKWAPCPPVWNQSLYNPLQVNENLTVPSKPISMLTDFIDGDGETIQPYNGAWIQQPIVRFGEPYVPIYRHPDGTITEIKVEPHGATQTKVTLTIYNKGLASINSNTPINFYMTTEAAPNVKVNETQINVGVDIFAGETVTRKYILTVSPVGYLVHCRLVDDGVKFPAAGFTDCDTTNNNALSFYIKANEDSYSLINTEVKFDVRLNDTAFCKLLPEITETPQNGTVVIDPADSLIKYKPIDPEFVGADSLEYAIHCTVNGVTLSDTAKVYIYVNPKPDNISDSDCFGEVAKTEWDMQLRKQTDWTKYPVQLYGLPFVGDLGGVDDKPEVVVVGAGADANYSNTIHIFNSNLEHLKTINTVDYMYVYGGFPIVLVKPNATAKPRIIVAVNGTTGNLYELRAYDIDGNLLKKSDISVAANKYYNNTTYYQHTPYLSVGDIDGDGKAELLVHNKIYDAESLELILTIGETHNDLKGVGLGYPYARGNTHSAVLADVDNDGKLEVVAGNSVYKIDITAKTSERIADVAEIDGFTSVADIDLDGYLDVVVTTVSANNAQLYAWSPKKGTVLGKSKTYPITTINRGVSRAFIGDFNKDGYPNPAFTTYNQGIIALKYNEAQSKFDELWAPVKTSEFSSSSGVTSLTLFDFNNDGFPELLHRDSKNLRILDAANPDPNNPLALISAPSSSGTEFPVVADIDGDGHADILISVNPNLSAPAPNIYKAELRWFSSKTPNSWAPARKVWNQYAYNSVNINEDLSVPKQQLNPATLFPASNLRPYNNFLQQQTMLNKNGEPLWLLPNGELVEIPSFNYNATTDSMFITLQVENKGEVAFQNPFYVTVYHDAVGGTPKHIHKHESAIMKGDTAIITIGIPNFKTSWQPFNDIVIRINDNGNGYNHQAVCDSANRDFKTGKVIAIDDYMLLFKNTTNNLINVTVNDFKQCTNPVVQIITPPKNASAYGVQANDSVIYYTPNTDYIGADSLKYRITCGADSHEAMVYINVIERPDNISDADCYIIPSATEWGISYTKTTAKNLSPYQNPVVGDIDGDGKIEILVSADPLTHTPVADRNSNKIYIYEGTNITGSPKYTITTQQPYSWDAYTKYGIVKTKLDGKDTVLIVVAERDKYLRAYNYKGTFIWKSSEVYHSHSSYVNRLTMTFADLNGDGVSEIMIGSKIFNSKGVLLSKVADITGNTGVVSVPVAADLYNTGKQNFILGNRVYTPNAALSSLSLTKTITPSVHSSDPDKPGVLPVIANGGRTSVIDMTLDGNPELVVSILGSNYTFIYIADPVTGNVLASKYLPSATSSYPFVGDIDNDKRPEIVFITGDAALRKIFAYKYVPNNPVLQKFWDLDHTDKSGLTVMTLFDFNNDSIPEIVYRDEDSLRIINGSLKSHITGNDTTKVYNLASFYNKSGTSTEYPVVADVDGDGQAEILIVGGSAPTYNYWEGELWVFKSHNLGQHPWAPARKVWNQYAYNVLNVNEDLTVPSMPLSSTTVFPGPDGQLGTADDVRPFNNFLQQQTELNKDGTPLWLAPDYVIDNLSTNYYSLGDSMVINVCVKNIGDAQGAAPFYITVYKNTRLAGNEMVTVQFPSVPLPGGPAICYSVKVENAGTANTLILSVNDKGGEVNASPECDYSNGTESLDMSDLVRAENDYATVFECGEITIPILANDHFTGSTFVITDNPELGTATPSGSNIKYENTGGLSLSCDQTGNMTDTITYKISSVTSSSTAKVFVRILKSPGMILEDACSVNPHIVLANTYADMEYTWEYSTDGTGTGAGAWQTVVANTSETSLNINKEGFYRVTVSHSSVPTCNVSKGIHVTLNRKLTLPGNVLWYDMSYSIVTITW